MIHDGVGMSMSSLSLLSTAKSRSISAENFTGEKGKGGMATDGTGAAKAAHLGRGWKISPSVVIKAGETFTLADIACEGAIQQIWMVNQPNVNTRDLIIRFYWDNQKFPSVEVPVGDFFCCGWDRYSQLSSLAVCVNPGRAFNCYWEMPFRQRARITLENRGLEETTVYYQINYTETKIPDGIAYFHAQFRRSNPLGYKDVHTILDQVQGRGHYVGTYIAWGSNSPGWWGEGEVKFYLDGDDEYPTICGTGTEDYFAGSYNFDVGMLQPELGNDYTTFTTPYAGLHEVIKPDGVYNSQLRFGMYRWHLTDPVRFQEDFKMTIQALGWSYFDLKDMTKAVYKPLQDDIASTAFWYQELPSSSFPNLPSREFLAT